MKALGLTGAGLGAAAALTAPVFHDLDEAISAGSAYKPWWVKDRPLENPTTEIDYTMIQPYDNTHTMNNATFENLYIPNFTAITAQGVANKTAWMLANNPGFRLQDWALNDTATIATGGQFPWSLWNPPTASGTQTTVTAVGANTVTVTTPTTLGVPKYTGTPDENARLLRSALRFFGVPISGYTALTANTKKFIYLQYPFDPNASKGYTANGTNYLPGQADLWVAELGSPNALQMMYAAPSMIGRAANGSMGHLQVTQAASSAQRFITELGYQCMHGGLENCTLHGAFLAFQGSGELGRATNQMITWDFGMPFSPTAITFDLPVTPTPPTDAGIQTFCRKCAKCADVCPSTALTHADLSWDVAGPWSVPGHKQFQNQEPLCRQFNTQIDSYCMTCQASCVFSKGSSAMIHEIIIKPTVSTTGAFDTIFKHMDDFFGYGDLSFNPNSNPLTGHFNTKANDWWERELPIYGIDKKQPTL